MLGQFSISGLASGIDTAGMIETIMEFARQPINRLNQRIDEKQTLLTAYKTLEANLLALKVDMAKLTKPATFEAKAVTVSDDTVLGATVTSLAPPGIYTLTVSQLAQNHQVTSQGFADFDVTDIGTGTMTLAVGERAAIEVVIDENNNTLEGLAQAINDADGDVQATIVNSGDPVAPYRLLLTSEHTGSAERISVGSTLSGGTAPVFGSVGPVIPGIQQGTSTVTSAGTWTGPIVNTISFTVDAVQGNGGVGSKDITISYTDGGEINGTFMLDENYVPGTPVDIVHGLQLSFSAGTLRAGDTFAVDVSSASIQEPLDAEFSLGSGATALTLTSATNTVTDLIEGLTLDLLKTSEDPVTLNVQADREAVKESITSFIDQYNAFVSFMNDMTQFDAETGIAGDLFGDFASRELYTALQNRLTGTVFGLDSAVDHLVEAGIRVGTDGTLSVDQSTLDDLIADDLEAVMKLFATSGETTDPNVRFLGASSDVVPFGIGAPNADGYHVFITQAAEKARLIAAQINGPRTQNPLVVDSSNNQLKIKVDGLESGVITIADGSYASGDALAAQIQKQIDLDESLASRDVTVRYVDDGGNKGHFEFESKSYGSNSQVEFVSPGLNSIYSDIGITAGDSAFGADVAGTINGEQATGVGQILTGDDGNANTDGLQLLVTITADDLIAQGNDQGFVKVTKGFAARTADFIAQITAQGSGKVILKEREFEASIEAFEDQIQRMEERLEKRRERLVRQFTIMEQLIGDMQGQTQFLTGALSNLAANTSMIRGIGG